MNHNKKQKVDFIKFDGLMSVNYLSLHLNYFK